MKAFTVRELEILKDSLNATDPSQKELLAKIWKEQRSIIKSEIRKAGN
jgi:hypothetical protein